MSATPDSVEWARVAAHATREQFLDEVADQLNRGALTVVAPVMFCFSYQSRMDDDPLLGQVTARPVLPGTDTADAIVEMGRFAARCDADLVLMLWDNQWLNASLGTVSVGPPGIVSLTASHASQKASLHVLEPKDGRRCHRKTIGLLPGPISQAVSSWRHGCRTSGVASTFS